MESLEARATAQRLWLDAAQSNTEMMKARHKQDYESLSVWSVRYLRYCAAASAMQDLAETLRN